MENTEKEEKFIPIAKSNTTSTPKKDPEPTHHDLFFTDKYEDLLKG